MQLVVRARPIVEALAARTPRLTRNCSVLESCEWPHHSAASASVSREARSQTATVMLRMSVMMTTSVTSLQMLHNQEMQDLSTAER